MHIAHKIKNACQIGALSGKKSLNNIAFTTIIGKILNLNGNYMYSMSFRKTEEPDQRGGETKSEMPHSQNSSSWLFFKDRDMAYRTEWLCVNGALSLERLFPEPLLGRQQLETMDLTLNLGLPPGSAYRRHSVICTRGPTQTLSDWTQQTLEAG